MDEKCTRLEESFYDFKLSSVGECLRMLCGNNHTITEPTHDCYDLSMASAIFKY